MIAAMISARHEVLPAETADSAQLIPPEDHSLTVETRFGRMQFDRRRCLSFPQGLPGFPDSHLFGLTRAPNPALSEVLLLQSIDTPQLAFAVVPVEPSSDLLAWSDVEEAGRNLGVVPGDVAALLIATLHRGEDGLSISVNTRAPVIVDSARNLAWQYVLSNDQYEIRQMM